MVEMRIFICLLVVTSWEQIIAPEVETCQVEGTTRLYTAAKYPQLCVTQADGTLEWSYFCGIFRMSEGKIFCKTLGYPSYQSDEGVSSNTIVGIKIANLDCMGSETKLTDCSFTETTNECMVAIGLVCGPCSSNSMCVPNGVCVMNGTCVCREGCDNGGYCFVGRCICPEGLGGPMCDECDPPCQNGGLCSASGDCQCIKPFDGPVCEFNSTTSVTNNNTMTTLQTTTVNTTTMTSNSEITLVIGVVVLSLIVSCTVIIVCLGILAFLAFLVTRMKTESNKKIPEQKEMPVIRESNSNNQPYNDSPTHDYCYIQDNQVSQSSPRSAKQADTDQGHYVIDDVNEYTK